MRYGRGHKDEARRRLIAAAGRGFRRAGYGGIGVDGLAKAADVTSGAFYGHFASKEAAFDAVVAEGLNTLRASILDHRRRFGAGWVAPYVDRYLGEKRLCDLGEACALQALSAEVSRAGASTQTTFAEHFAGAAKAAAEGLQGRSAGERLQRAYALLAILSGSVTLARAVGEPGAGGRIAAGVRKAALAIAEGRLAQVEAD
ncbi:MAG: TetR/AcrR family transcriptional regulator [Bauldia sp.]